MEEKTTITFNISGGNNQILPNATEAVQNFYGSEFSKSVSQEENDFQNSLSATEVQKLIIAREMLKLGVNEILKPP